MFGPVPRNCCGWSIEGSRSISLAPRQTSLRLRAICPNAFWTFPPPLPQTATTHTYISNSFFLPYWSLFYIPRLKITITSSTHWTSKLPKQEPWRQPWCLPFPHPTPITVNLSSIELLRILVGKFFWKFKVDCVTSFWRLSVTALCLNNQLWGLWCPPFPSNSFFQVHHSMLPNTSIHNTYICIYYVYFIFFNFVYFNMYNMYYILYIYILHIYKIWSS